MAGKKTHLWTLIFSSLVAGLVAGGAVMNSPTGGEVKKLFGSKKAI